MRPHSYYPRKVKPSFSSLFSFLFLLPVVAKGQIDFVHQIVPVLKEHCTECHGGEEAKGGFSLNTRELFLDDETAIPGEAEKSYFIELILDSDPDYQMPPEKKARVPKEQVQLLKQWVDEGMKWEPGFTFGEPTYEPPLKPRRPALPQVTDARGNPIDRIIDHYLSENALPRPEPIDDATFLRRVSLDLTGLLPTPDEARNFLSDVSPDKRTQLIEDLLSRDIAYTEHWLTFWNDLLRNDYDGTGFITGGRTQISEWLYDSLKSNKPFDQMVRELVAPQDKSSSGFIDGIKWRGTVSAGQTLPIQFSQSISQSFLGINMKCASCHDSFIDRWTLADAYGLAAIYSEEPLEIHRCDKPIGETASAAWLFPEIGKLDSSKDKAERLRQLAHLMTHPDNGRVPRTIVNRLWGQLMGHGIVHPLDAMQTEPWNEDLLDWLASDFQDNGYDLKRTLRLITNSQAYQSQTTEQKETAEFVYDGPRTKRMTAEAFVDAIWQITGTAPVAYHAPVARGVVPTELTERLSFPSSWVWGSSIDKGPPPNGEQILLRREFTPTKPIRSAGIIAAADNSFVLYLNNKQILSGEKWTDLEAGPILNHLRPKTNRILIVAENRGARPNAAGVFCAVRIEYQDDTEEIIVTDSSWQVTNEIPKDSRPARWKLEDLEWESAKQLGNITWKKQTDPKIGETLATASVGSSRMIRASLLKADDLMRSLGRPNRDQIVTSRPSELTTLEAIDLSTSNVLFENLEKGASAFLAKNLTSTEELVEEIYLTLLTRRPTQGEISILTEILGESPEKGLITDTLWSLTMTPEFLLIR
ncbi:MAG: hypothetical protein CMO55_19415 [Verrucomicrobiales bacterium]|nr:hypothetical protein [Verrucomicrobiales bacterium]